MNGEEPRVKIVTNKQIKIVPKMMQVIEDLKMMQVIEIVTFKSLKTRFCYK